MLTKQKHSIVLHLCISTCLKLYVPKRDYLCLDYPITRNKAGDRTFTVCASKLWNNLSKRLRNSSSVNAFKKALKTHKLTVLFYVYIKSICMFIVISTSISARSLLGIVHQILDVCISVYLLDLCINQSILSSPVCIF